MVSEDFIQDIIQLRDDLSYDWSSIAKEMNSRYGSNLSPDAYRKRYSRYKDSQASNISINDIIQHKKEIDENTQLNAIYRRIAREETIKEIAKDFASQMNSKFILNTKRLPDDIYEEEGLLLLSDWHYGIEINEFYNKYNPEIAQERVENLLAEIIKRCKGKINHLTILNLGDMIAGNIHLPIRLNSRKDVISQVLEVSEIIAEFISELSYHFDIDYYSVIDNHSRIDPNKKDALQLESLCRITDWYLKDRLYNVNVHTNEFGLDIATFNVCGLNVLGVHGDKDKPKTLIDKLTCYTQGNFDIMCSAHYHHFSCDESNNTLLVSNGSLMGTDSYATGLRLNNKPSQTLLILSKNKVENIQQIIL